ncbi:MAG TPA: DsrE family protein [Usitatibacteraceae bacterium]|nr:DsrE family protein [Usitatibacteraceae bacterium]
MNCSLGKAAAAATLALAASASAMAAPGEPVKVIYHINTGNEQATDGLRNANNHLAADPKAKIVFVTHANGVHFLLDGAKDKNGNSYDALVQDLMGKGVEFRLCRFTLERQKIDPKKVIQDVKIVPSGVAEVSRLQSQEGFAYLKP